VHLLTPLLTAGEIDSRFPTAIETPSTEFLSVKTRGFNRHSTTAGGRKTRKIFPGNDGREHRVEADLA
jgi:hypothetical protein